MKYVCFGFLNESNWTARPDSEQKALLDACFAYDEELKRNGHWAGGEGLGGPDATTTLQLRNGKVLVTDGPFIESKELLGGLLIIEAQDLNEAVRLISNHPGMKMGTWEIRPVIDLGPMIEESRKRREQSARAIEVPR